MYKVRALLIIGALFQLLGTSSSLAAHAAGAGALDQPGPWTNTLGLVFVPVPRTKVLFCIWKTRVMDFQRFVQEARYKMSERGWVLSPSGDPADKDLFGSAVRTGEAPSRVGTWKNPGFKQGPTHPVCGVDWADAHLFCSWLTKKERQEGVLRTNEIYRLPADVEWSCAVGESKYSWGSEWPPPPGAGNFAGEEVLDGPWPTNRAVIHGYRDGFARTSPAGSFAPNQYGIFDMIGNLSEWCEDYFQKEMNNEEIRRQIHPVDFAQSGSRVLRGASWAAATPLGLNSTKRGWAPPNTRLEGIGFRVVLAPDDGRDWRATVEPK